MREENIRLTFYGKDSEEHKNLERQLRLRGYDIRLITCGRDKPVISSSNGMLYVGLRNICDSFHIHPKF